jgi:regulator of nucleoside diphosphate kinase
MLKNFYSLFKLRVMQKIKEPIILREDDYEVLISHLKNQRHRNLHDLQNVNELQGELKKAKLVNKDNFPNDVVRLNSRVKIKDSDKGKVMDFILVTPDKADIREGKISVMAPVGTALIGFRKGKKINWQVPAGQKTFTIMEVIN